AIKYFSYQRTLQAAIALVIVIVWIGQGHTVYMRNQRFSDPVSLWSDNAEKAPGLSRVHTNLGNAYFDNNVYDMAYESYMRAKKADYFHRPESRGVLHYALGRYYFHEEDNHGKAIYHLNLSRHLYPGNWHGWYYLLLAEMSRGNYERAQNMAAKACSRWPENEPLQYIKGLSLLKQGEYYECIKVAREALSRGLGAGRFYKLMGVSYLYEGELDAASRFLSLAHKKLSGDIELMLAIVDTYQEMGDFEAIDEVLRELICEKGAKSWEKYIGEVAEENVLNAYEVKYSRLIGVIRGGMCRLSP
ncbi:MAG: tetratricopeptide repeat protein, partial [Desulfosalsimonas sp.]